MLAVRTETVFAWLPVKTENAGWVWLQNVTRETDDNPEHYLGLLPKVRFTVPNTAAS